MSKELVDILAPYQHEKGATIPVLQRVQEALGYLSEEAISEIARFLNLSESEVFGVASFYTQFRFSRPAQCCIKVCLGTACHVKGGSRIKEALEQELGISAGEATPDYKFSVERVACFGSCALAPVIVLDHHVYGRMTPAKAKELLASLKRQG